MGDQYRLAENLRYFRQKNKLSESNLASELGLSQQGYSKYETGKSSPDAEKLLWLANRYRVSTDFLLTGNPELFPETLCLFEESGYAANQKASLSEEEERLLSLLRRLTPEAKAELLRYLDFRFRDSIP